MKNISLIRFALVLTVFSVITVTAQSDNSVKYQMYYPHLEEAMDGKYQPGKGVAWKPDRLRMLSMNADEINREVYFVIDTVAVYSPFEGEEQLVLITHTEALNPQGEKINDCHACSTTIGAFIFQKEEGKWRLYGGNESLTKAGSFGAQNYNVAVQPLKYEEFLLIVRSVYSGMGESTETTQLFIGLNLVMQLNTAHSGSYFTADGEKSFRNTTKIRINNDTQTITAVREGTELDAAGKIRKVNKSRSWHYIDEGYKTWEF